MTHFFEYIARHDSHLLVGGIDLSDPRRKLVLSSFWQAFKVHHGQHAIYGRDENELCNYIPICLHGDEGRTRKKGAIYISSWQPCLGNVSCSLGDSTSAVLQAMSTNMKQSTIKTRYVTSVMPAHLYKDRPQLFHDMNDHLAQNLKSLFEQGVTTLDGTRVYAAVVALKGDWVNQVKTGKLLRGYSRTGKNSQGICHLCNAGQPGCSYEDVTETAAWRQTMHSELPWDEASPSPLLKVPCMTTTPADLWAFDLFHTTKLGVARSFAASVVVWTAEVGSWGSEGFDPVLDKINTEFLAWCAAGHKHPFMKRITRDNLAFSSRKEIPKGSFKGSDTALLIAFIEQFTRSMLSSDDSLPHRSAHSMILLAAESMNLMYHELFQEQLWLSRESARSISSRGRTFLLAYAWLAKYTLEHHDVPRFALTPKIHALDHIVTSVAEQQAKGAFTLSPLMSSTEQDEDFIGRIARLSRRVDSRTVMTRSLQRYLVLCRSVWAT